MSLQLNCFRCRKELDRPSALIFAEPDKKGNCKKFHVCWKCWRFVLSAIKPLSKSNVGKSDE